MPSSRNTTAAAAATSGNSADFQIHDPENPHTATISSLSSLPPGGSASRTYGAETVRLGLDRTNHTPTPQIHIEGNAHFPDVVVRPQPDVLASRTVRSFLEGNGSSVTGGNGGGGGGGGGGGRSGASTPESNSNGADGTQTSKKKRDKKVVHIPTEKFDEYAKELRSPSPSPSPSPTPPDGTATPGGQQQQQQHRSPLPKRIRQEALNASLTQDPILMRGSTDYAHQSIADATRVAKTARKNWDVQQERVQATLEAKTPPARMVAAAKDAAGEKKKVRRAWNKAKKESVDADEDVRERREVLAPLFRAARPFENAERFARLSDKAYTDLAARPKVGKNGGTLIPGPGTVGEGNKAGARAYTKTSKTLQGKQVIPALAPIKGKLVRGSKRMYTGNHPDLLPRQTKTK